MTKWMLALSGLLLLVLPQAARAQDQSFNADHQYTAKFVCGETSGSEQRLGVVGGHYNTIINVLALKKNTTVAYRATAVSTDLDTQEGVPSIVSQKFGLDRDFGFRIVCNDIKQLLDVNGQQGFVEGFVTVFTTNPLVVTGVVTGEGIETEVSVLQVTDAERQNSKGTVKPSIVAE